MKLPHKITVVSFAITLLAGFIIALQNAPFDTTKFFWVMGLVGFCAGVLQLLLGLLLLFKTDKRYAQGFLLSSGVLLLAGFTTCSAYFSINIH